MAANRHLRPVDDLDELMRQAEAYEEPRRTREEERADTAAHLREALENGDERSVRFWSGIARIDAAADERERLLERLFEMLEPRLRSPSAKRKI